MFIVPLHWCQNLTLPNVPTRGLLPGNPTTAASATVWGLNGHTQWLLGARNWITVIIERSDHSLVTYWGLNFRWWLFTTFWYVISKKRKKSCFFEIWKKRKMRILEHCLWRHRLLWIWCKHCSCCSSGGEGQGRVERRPRKPALCQLYRQTFVSYRQRKLLGRAARPLIDPVGRFHFWPAQRHFKHYTLQCTSMQFYTAITF